MGALLALMPFFSNLLTALVPDPIKKAEAEAALQTALNQAQASLEEAQSKNLESITNMISSEERSGYWLAANWHACFMMMFGFILLNQYILNPILGAFGVHMPIPPFDDGLWTLMSISMGGGSILHVGSQAMKTVNKAKFYADLREKLGSLDKKTVSAIESSLLDSQS